MVSHQPENALGLDLKQAPPSASVDANNTTVPEVNKQSKSPVPNPTSPKPDGGKKDPKGKGKERKTAAEGPEKAPTSPGADTAVPVSPTAASAADGEDKDATDKPDLSRPSKTKPYVNPDRVQTGGSQRDKLTPDELAERMARMKMQNEKIKQRRLDVQADEDAFKKTQEAERARLAKARKVQEGVDNARQANAQRKMDKVQAREWDFNKPQRGGRGGGAPGPSRITGSGPGAPEGGESGDVAAVSPKLDTASFGVYGFSGSGEATSHRGAPRGAPRGARGSRGGPGRGGRGAGRGAAPGGDIAKVVVPEHSQPSTIGEGPKDTSA